MEDSVERPDTRAAGETLTPLRAILAVLVALLGSGIVYPQWRDRERLPFPLLNVHQALIGDPDEDAGRVLPAIFHSRAFGIGCRVVFIIHAFRGLNVFTGSFPEFPLSRDLSPYFTDGLIRHAPSTLRWAMAAPR